MEQKSLWLWLSVLAMACWATVYPLSKLIDPRVDPLLLAFLRFFVASIVLLPIVPRRSSRMPVRGDWLTLIAVSAFAVLPTALIVIGIRWSSSIVASILTNTNPLIVALLAPLFIREPFRVRSLVMICIGIVGISMVMVNGQPFSSMFSSAYLRGALILLGASLTSACFAMTAKGLVQRYGGWLVTSLAMGIGTALLLGTVLVTGAVWQLVALSPLTWVLSILIGIVSTAVPFLLWTSSIPHLGATNATTFKLLIPLFATVYALLFLGERMTVWMVLGMVLIIVGIGGSAAQTADVPEQ